MPTDQELELRAARALLEAAALLRVEGEISCRVSRETFDAFEGEAQLIDIEPPFFLSKMVYRHTCGEDGALCEIYFYSEPDRGIR